MVVGRKAEQFAENARYIQGELGRAVTAMKKSDDRIVVLEAGRCSLTPG